MNKRFRYKTEFIDLIRKWEGLSKEDFCKIYNFPLKVLNKIYNQKSVSIEYFYIITEILDIQMDSFLEVNNSKKFNRMLTLSGGE